MIAASGLRKFVGDYCQKFILASVPNPSERLNETMSVANAKLITKILRHHQAMNATVHYADANASEVFLENVGAMAG